MIDDFPLSFFLPLVPLLERSKSLLLAVGGLLRKGREFLENI